MLKDLLQKSRSYRSFDRTVSPSEEQLREWISDVRFCPSSINLQVLKFRPVLSEAECERVLSMTRWAAKLRDIHLPPAGHDPTAYIVVCADTGITQAAATFEKDVGIAAQTIMLAAAEAGFGGCILGSFRAQELCEALALPEQMVPKLVLALGKPDERVELTDETEDGNVDYYRENGVHYVRKRPAEELVIPAAGGDRYAGK